MLAITPYLQRRGEVFAVTVPTAAQADPYLRGLKRRYLWWMLGITALLTAVAVACAVADAQTVLFVLMVAGSLALCAVSVALMLRYRSKTRAYKRERGWKAEAQQAVATVGDQEVPRAFDLRWNLLYVPVLLVLLAVGVAGYGQMPDMVPMHSDLAGNVTRWEPKGPGIVAFPILMGLFLAACFAFSHWSIARSKKWAEPGAPATSALAYGMFARAMSVVLLVTGLLLTATIGLVFLLSSMDMLSLGQAAVIVIVGTVPLIAGSILVSVVYGQAGSRVFRRMQGSDQLLVDDDEHWKLGIFYWNPNDPSLFLPERFGIGWTANWARPAIWAIMLGMLAVTAVFIIGISLTVGM